MILEGDWSNPYQRITFRGVTVNRRTAAMLLEAEKVLGYELTCTQGSYNPGGVGASGGTHDGGGAVDLAPFEADAKQRALRKVGFAAWHRYPIPGTWPEHVHAIAIGDRDLSTYAAAQVVDYRNDRDGLYYHQPDPSWHPNPIPTFNYAKWLEEQVTSDDIDRIVNRVVRELKSDFANIADAVWAADVVPVPDNVGSADDRKNNPTNGAANALSRVWKAAQEGATP